MTVGEMIAALSQHEASKRVIIGLDHAPVEILAVMDWGGCGVAITAVLPRANSPEATTPAGKGETG